MCARSYHEDHGGGAGEHVLAADRTVAFQVALDAAVFILYGDAHTDIALLAVEEIVPEAPALPADATVVAVVDALLWIIVPQLTLIAVIPSSDRAALATGLCRRLQGHTLHAQHIFGILTYNGMIARVIVAKAAWKDLLTAVRLQFDIALIMLAPKDSLFLILSLYERAFHTVL